MTCGDSALTSVNLADVLEHMTSMVLCLWCGLARTGLLLFWISPPSSHWGLKSLDEAGDWKRHWKNVVNRTGEQSVGIC